MILKKGTKKPTSLKLNSDSESVAITLQPYMKEILAAIDEDPTREGLIDTPKRFGKSIQFLTSGYRTSVSEVVGKALFKAESSEMVIVKDIELYSLCEHHMLPFFGKAHVAYIPDKNALMETLKPLGVAVVIEAAHFCMMMRGVEKQNSQTITSAMRGEFYSDASTRGEFLNLLRIK
jgi:GTP cyclohydrolase I